MTSVLSRVRLISSGQREVEQHEFEISVKGLDPCLVKSRMQHKCP